jgi:FkbM family methyltransferase
MIELLGRVAAFARAHGLEGALRFSRDLGDAVLLRARTPPLSVTVGGIKLRGFLRHRSFLAELATGGYEPTVCKLYVEAVAGAEVVIDVGAHTGFYSLLAARTNRSARVIAVEADPYNAVALAANARGTRVQVVAMAASDHVGRSAFRQNLGTVGSSLLDRSGTGPVRVVEVETTTIDALAREPRALVMKIDVEGAELAVLAGATATISGAVDATLLVELNPKALAAGGHSGADLVAALEALGLEVGFIDETVGQITETVDIGRKGNLVARKP